MDDISVKFEFVPNKSNSSKGRLTARKNGQVLAMDTVNLANAKARSTLAESLTEQCPGLDLQEVQDNLLQLAEQHVRQDRENTQGQDADQQNHPLAKSKAALEQTKPELVKYAREFLALPNLIELIPAHLHQLGVAGEKELGLMLYLIGTSRLLMRPLAGSVMGGSSGGKSYVISKVAKLFPEEAILQAHRISPRALEHMAPGSLVHRFVVAGERSRLQDDSAAEVTRALREMIGDGRLSTLVSVQNKPGKWDTAHIQQEGPIAYVECTTLGIRDINDEDRTRFVLLSVDESLQQTTAVIRELAKAASNPGDPDEADSIVALHHTIQRLLQPLDVVVPFAPELTRCLPRGRLEVRRSFGHLLGDIQAVALLHQFQRERHDQGGIIAVQQDYDIVREHLAGPLARSLGCGLTPGAAALLAVVKAMGGSFTVGQAATKAQRSENTARSRLKELVAAGQLVLVEQSKGRAPAKYSMATDPPPLSGLILPTLELPQSKNASPTLLTGVEDNM